ncbi:MAG: HD domain-containing phosphohydrolase [Solirubrobacteraceae bacterium]
MHDPHILIVDDHASNVMILELLLAQDGYTNVTSITDPGQVVDQLRADPPDLVLLDLHMPEIDGFEVMRLVQEHTPPQVQIPILVITGDGAQDARRRALDAGARDFVAKPFDSVELSLRIRNLLQTRRLHLDLHALNATLEGRVAQRTAELAQTRMEVFRRLALAGEYRDDDTRQHTKRVGIASGLLAAELGLDAAIADIIETAAPLHDLGKIGIPDEILLKPSGLTEAERAVMHTHTTIGGEILAGSGSPLLEIAAEIAMTHHERWDGLGYPWGLKQEQIPLSGRIVGVVDAFDAMTHDRPYRPAVSIADAVAEVTRSSGTQFDPAVVDAFLRLDPELLNSPPLQALRTLPESAWQRVPAVTMVAAALASPGVV